MTNMKRSIWLLLFLAFYGTGELQAQVTAKFNFTAAASTVSGWTNIAGDPTVAPRSGMMNGVTVSSINTFNWTALPGIGAAYNGLGQPGGTFFPSTVMANHWFQGTDAAQYNALLPQLWITGLNKDSV